MMKLSSLTGLRAAGTLGIALTAIILFKIEIFLLLDVSVIKHVRSDLREKFTKLFDDDRILIYLFHCNAQLPTGEKAFRIMSDCYTWTKEPIIDRIHLLDERIPIYFLHGKQAWIKIESSLMFQK
ncbi:unnamed protein product [Rotaria sordida]|uniref:Uncharacterized protein n=1 Tax=Rotaria sordida TaxID=392033 RepID=A0A815BQD8_9BILA|nr:unnamed protein product [Rotaria sordida]CAF3907643.1 unnamed protein product [Rotaria sordida]